MMKRILFVAVLLAAGANRVSAQITVPNTFVSGTTVASAAVNTNFTTLANHALDRLSGGNLAGDITADALVTIDGVDVGVQACIACAPTHSSMVLTNSTPSSLVSAGGLVLGGGIFAGSGVVQIVDGTGKIPALSSTYIASLSGANLTALRLRGCLRGLRPRQRPNLAPTQL